MNTTDVKRVLEAALLCSPEPLSMNQIRRLFDNEYGPELLRPVLDDLAADWSQRPVQLVPVASGWRFQSRPEYAAYINRLSPEKAPKYSRAVMETLAIIAYRQPVTRGDIEEIRGVSVSAQIIKTLEERGWIDMIGHKDVPGRPSLFGTTRQFLDDLGLRSLKELPAIESLGEEESDFFSEQVVALTSTPGEVVGREASEAEGDGDAVGPDALEGEGVEGEGDPPADPGDSRRALHVASVAPSVDTTNDEGTISGDEGTKVVADSLEIDELVHLAESLNLVATPISDSAAGPLHDEPDRTDADGDSPGPMER